MKINYEIISSRNNPFVKWMFGLQNKKGRENAGSFLAEGEKLSFEALEAGLPVSYIVLSESKSDKLLPRVKLSLENHPEMSTEVVIMSDSAFEKVSTEKAPQGIISVIKYLDFFKVLDIIYKEEFSLSENERVIILSSVRDPGNLGSVIRSAVAFGVDHIILTDDCADLYNPKTVRSAMGSLFRVKTTVVSNFKSLVDYLRSVGRKIYSAELSATAHPLGKVSLKPTDAVIIGNEGHGVSAEISALSDGGIYIPISKRTESLNASVAAAIFMWEQNK